MAREDTNNRIRGHDGIVRFRFLHRTDGCVDDGKRRGRSGGRYPAESPAEGDLLPGHSRSGTRNGGLVDGNPNLAGLRAQENPS
jgi:hypothetical protein